MNKGIVIILSLVIVGFYFYSDYWRKKAKVNALNIADRVDVDGGTGVITVLNSLNQALITLTPKENPIQLTGESES